MKNILLIGLLFVLSISCSNSKNTVKDTNSSYWSVVVADNVPEKYTKYPAFLLNEKDFIKALEKGFVLLPDNKGAINSFTIEETQTMSAELAAKFPNIKSYKGKQNNNSLCKPRIERNESKIKISVFCNDKTYFIDKVKEQSIYIVYTKQNAPIGIGVVQE